MRIQKRTQKAAKRAVFNLFVSFAQLCTITMASRVLGFLRRGQVLYELEKPRTHIGRATTNDIVIDAQVCEILVVCFNFLDDSDFDVHIELAERVEISLRH
jgi:hypothetical protein